MTNNFLPDNYEVPTTTGGGDYMKLEKGENIIRILSKPIIGWQYWNTDKKPVRLKEQPMSIPEDIRRNDKGEAERVKHFWAMKVYNYKAEAVQILEITQSTVIGAITELSKDEDWGSPLEYDLKITRTGEGLETEYSVIAKPSKLLSEDVLVASDAKPVNLEALFSNGNPFEVSPATSKSYPKPIAPSINPDDIPF